MADQGDPLTLATPTEVPLPRAPLIRVVAQVRFPQVLSIEKREFVAPFQEAIRARYAVLRAEQSQSVVVGPHGTSTLPPQIVWRFGDVDGAWRVSLAPDFAAIETTAYTSRQDFLERLEAIVLALAEHVNPRVLDRLGVRYIDRITGDATREVDRLVRPEVLGVVATPAANHVRHSLNESLFTVPDTRTQLLARWGLLPEGSTVDPAAIEPIASPSWILDLDMFRAEPGTFEPAAVVSDVREFAERIYTFFRWAVTDDFLRLYGGQV